MKDGNAMMKLAASQWCICKVSMIYNFVKLLFMNLFSFRKGKVCGMKILEEEEEIEKKKE